MKTFGFNKIFLGLAILWMTTAASAQNNMPVTVSPPVGGGAHAVGANKDANAVPNTSKDANAASNMNKDANATGIQLNNSNANPNINPVAPDSNETKTNTVQ